MLSKIAKECLVSTAFAPVLLTLAYRYWKMHDSLIFGACLILVVELCALCLLILRLARTQLQITPITVTSVKTADTEIVGFVIAYLLPLVSSNETAVDINALVLTLFILFGVVWATHTYHVNPVLAVFRYHFYEITDDGDVSHILITKRTLRASKEVTQTVQLTDYMLLDVSKNT